MTGNKIITVHSKRREHRTHRAKRKAHKQSDDYHDGYINSADKPHPHHSDFDLCCNGGNEWNLDCCVGQSRCGQCRCRYLHNAVFQKYICANVKYGQKPVL